MRVSQRRSAEATGKKVETACAVVSSVRKHHMEEADRDAASGKRKTCQDHVDVEDDEEQKKMEIFYDLIRNIREARDRLMNGSDASNGLQNKKKKKTGEDDYYQKQRANIQVWTPSFQREDFMEESRDRELAQFKTDDVVDGSSEREAEARKENDKEEGEDQRLDLNLSL